MMIFSGLPVLDVSQLAEHWPKWRQHFEIYILAAFNNKLEDRQKLGLFLHCLGPGGIEKITGWFPALNNINSPLAMGISFAEVWNKWHIYCQSVKPQTSSEGPSDWVHISSGTSKTPMIINSYSVDINNASPTLDINFLCEFETFIADNAEKRSIIYRRLSEGHKLSIDASTLARFPIADNGAVYAEYAVHATNLEISAVPESDVKELLVSFKNLTKLTLENVFVVGDVSQYPLNLQFLHMTQCTCNQIFEWLNLMRTSLEVLHLSEVRFTSKTLLTHPFQKLKSLVMTGTQVYLREQLPICPVIEKLYLDFSNASKFFCWLPRSPVRSLFLKDCWPEEKTSIIKGYKNLKYLTILNRVHPKRKEEIDKLQLDKVNVDCLDLNTEKANLILQLNDDCLLRVLQFLPGADWCSLKEVHPRFNKLFDLHNQYYIGRSSLKSRPFDGNQEFYAGLGKRITSLVIGDVTPEELFPVFKCFTKLTALEFKGKFKLTNEFVNYFEINCQKLRVFKAPHNELGAYLSLNHENIEYLEVDSNYSMKVISRLRNLRVLRLRIDSDKVQGCPNLGFPALEHLSFQSFSSYVDEFLGKIDGLKLRTIKDLPRFSKYDLNNFPQIKDQNTNM